MNAVYRRGARSALLFLAAASLLSLTACATVTPPPTGFEPPLPTRADAFPPHETLRAWAEDPKYPRPRGPLGPIAETWIPLLERLKADGLDGDDLLRIFAKMGDTYSPKPMGAKITELFTYKYIRPPAPRASTTPPAYIGTQRVYPGFVTPGTIEVCRAYLDANELYFTVAEDLFSVPREVIVALLMVETKLGTFLGHDNAFWSLACMAAADIPERIEEPLSVLPDVDEERLAWVSEKLQERSAWAYKELKALIKHIEANDLDPLEMPGSIYGAIGICQFMPSNLGPYGVDGDKDGKVDLFDPADAIPSVGNYLKGHGWKPTLARDERHAVIKRYNNSTVYANTILALAEAITGEAE